MFAYFKHVFPRLFNCQENVWVFPLTIPGVSIWILHLTNNIPSITIAIYSFCQFGSINNPRCLKAPIKKPFRSSVPASRHLYSNSCFKFSRMLDRNKNTFHAGRLSYPNADCKSLSFCCFGLLSNYKDRI